MKLHTLTGALRRPVLLGSLALLPLTFSATVAQAQRDHSGDRDQGTTNDRGNRGDKSSDRGGRSNIGNTRGSSNNRFDRNSTHNGGITVPRPSGAGPARIVPQPSRGGNAHGYSGRGNNGYHNNNSYQNNNYHGYNNYRVYRSPGRPNYYNSWGRGNGWGANRFGDWRIQLYLTPRFFFWQRHDHPFWTSDVFYYDGPDRDAGDCFVKGVVVAELGNDTYEVRTDSGVFRVILSGGDLAPYYDGDVIEVRGWHDQATIWAHGEDVQLDN